MRVFEVEGENCYSKKDKKVEGSIKVELKAGSLMSVYIDLNEAEEFTATTVSRDILFCIQWNLTIADTLYSGHRSLYSGQHFREPKCSFSVESYLFIADTSL